jgi:hypothetical protein
MISGTLQAGGKSIALKGRMSGDRISFSAGSAEYRGRVGPGSITGTLKMDGANREWTAIRK